MPYQSALALLLVSLATASCVAYQPPGCTAAADCASGVCNADGTCGSTATSSGSSSSSSGSGGGSGSCSPNNNGVITRAQVVVQPGLHANFLSAENATVNTAGTMNAQGVVEWDFSVTYSGDHPEDVVTVPISGQWFAADFTGASYAARLSDSSTLLGVFTITDTDLQLVGVVSPGSGSMQTELKYDPAVVVLQFPLMLDATWSTTSTVTGEAEGIDVLYTETYQNSVDLGGSVKTPYSTFDALRVNTVLTRVVGALVTSTRTFSFITQCFGSIASAVSNADDPTVDFTSAAVISRLAP
jgi:hypothetical protein